MGGARGSVGVVTLLSLLVVLGYAATARGLPTRGAKTPLTRQELKEVEADVNGAIARERSAVEDIDRFGKEESQGDLEHALSDLRSAELSLGEHDLGHYDSALTDVKVAHTDDNSA